MKLCFMVVGQAHLFVVVYILATSKVTAGWVQTCDNAHSWYFCSAASLGCQAASTMTCYLMQSHYPDTEPTSPCPILIMPSTWLGSDKYQFVSHWFDLTMGSNPWSPARETRALPIRPPHPVCLLFEVPEFAQCQTQAYAVTVRWILNYSYVSLLTQLGSSDRICRARASHAGDWEFGSGLTQINDLSNW